MTSLRRLGAAMIIFIACAAAFPVFSAEDDAAADKDAFPPEQIEQLVAPIALYPDALIAQMLMASTYPLDVVQANRWLGDHEGVEGDALQDAVDAEVWDDSVKALVFFPSVLGFMSDNLDWTQDLGDAVLAQQGDVTDAIQRLRGDADEAGTLASSEQQRVEHDGDTIIIQPAQPEVVYVPTYDPAKVYGEPSPPAKTYYPDAYADASASYDAGYAAGASATAYVPSGEVVPAGTVSTTESSSSDGLVNFGIGAIAGGLLTAAIMWDDNDRYDRVYYGGPGRYGAPSYWGQPNYWNGNNWRQPNNIQVNRNLDVNRNVERGDINVNKGIVGNEINSNRVKKWEHNPERRGGVRYRDQSTENRFTAKRKERTIDRDAARGRVPRAPDVGKVKREGAASGGLTKLGEGRGQGGAGTGLKDRAGNRPIKAPPIDKVKREGAASGKVASLKERGGAAGARDKVKAKAPAAKARPKPKTKPAAKRPVNKQAKRPAVAKAKRPAKAAPRAKRPAAKAGTRPKATAFKPSSKPKMSRAASQRGGASRAKASRGGGGARRGGGGGGRARGR